MEEQYLMSGMDSLSLPNHFFQQVVDQAPVGISISDLHATIVYCNACFCQITGYPKAQVLGKNHNILSYKTTPPHIYQQLWQAIQQGQRWQGTLVNRKADGQRYIADLMIAPIMNEQQQITHYMSVQRDITQQHELSLRLKNQKCLVEQVLNDMPAAVVLLNTRGHILLDNLAYKTLTTDLQQDPFQFVWAQWQQLNPNASFSTFAQHHHDHSFTADLMVKGHKRWLSCRVASLAMTNSSADSYFSQQFEHHWIVTLSERTREIQQIERQRQQQLQLLLTESDMLYRMQEALSAATHQMQGPMNVLEAALSMLQKRNEPCAGSAAIRTAFTAGQDALQYLQQAAPRKHYESFQSVNVNALLQDVLSMLHPQLMKQSIDVVFQPQPDLPALIGQPMRLRCAFKQLLQNAIDSIARHCDGERLIQVLTMQSDEMLTIDMIDTGIGIDSAEQIKIFQPFYSGYSQSQHTQGARGLGLSIVQQVMNDHTATLDVQPRDVTQSGAHFVLQFPLHPQPQGSPL